jgi:tetratricopeptide (TPR) repeat protein
MTASALDPHDSGGLARRRLAVSLALLGLVLCGSWAEPSAADDDTVASFYVAIAALDAGDNPRASQVLGDVTQAAPDEAAAWANLGLAEFRLGNLDAAAAALDKAGRLEPGSAEIEALRATLAQYRGQPAEAEARLRRSLELDPQAVKPRYALLQTLQRSRDADPAVIGEQLDLLLTARPQSLVLLLQRAIVALDLEDTGALESILARVEPVAAGWTGLPREQFDGLKTALADSDARMAKRRLALLSNVLKPEPSYRYDLAELQDPTGVLAMPLRSPFTFTAPRASFAPADTGIEFSPRPFDADASQADEVVLATWLSGESDPTVFIGDGAALRQSGNSTVVLGFRRAADTAPPSSAAAAALDWDYDFRTDFMLAGAGGLRLFAQAEPGTFRDVSGELGLESALLDLDYHGAWAVDIEADGDLDLVVAPRDSSPSVLRNNGDGTFEPVAAYAGLAGVRHFSWSDLDGDGDPDAAFLDASGTLHVYSNLRGGRFEPRALPPIETTLAAITTGDIDDNGSIDLAMLGTDGRLLQLTDRNQGRDWALAAWSSWERMPDSAPGDAFLRTADMDNNGTLDVVASVAGQTRIWLENGTTDAVVVGPQLALTDLADLNADGRVDVLGIDANGRAMWAENSGSLDYGWQIIRLAANRNGGDQRINSLAAGSEVEIRTGRLTQRRLAVGRPLHFGLGDQRIAEVVRIVWPNGAVQTDYDLRANTTIEAEQRLKGSCPFVFAYDGEGMRFVTDFLWRSPLGLRINAQDTAGQLQTEDWVRIDGDQLQARDGYYELRITADLWETHFFDHVSLLIVDHPETREVFVDERFAHPQPPLAATVTTPPRPLNQVWDHRGKPVSELVAARDGRYVDSFALGRFQGLAEPHWIEAELPDDVPRQAGLTLIANGWVYPTDSSLNVAIGQGAHARPEGLVLEVTDADGRWQPARADLGFPAGKKKTVLIDLDGIFLPGAPRRFRLRTNLEVYWDFLGWGIRDTSDSIESQRISADLAELRYRGFSVMRQASRRAPDLPVYSELAGGQQRWRDLEGFHTRFGDVGELLTSVDDRYVIMNAGDELVLRFSAPAELEGHKRTFILIGDGWVKDGDYNTVASRTVLPLPRHDQAEYEPGTGRLEDDPVYLRYPDDWVKYHTRYVAPDHFRLGLNR